MSAPGRPKGEYRSAQHEGTPASRAAAREMSSPDLISDLPQPPPFALSLSKGAPCTALASTGSARTEIGVELRNVANQVTR